MSILSDIQYISRSITVYYNWDNSDLVSSYDSVVHNSPGMPIYL